jgi:hypothetical protein
MATTGEIAAPSTQAHLRVVNERIRLFADGYLHDSGLTVVCECEDGCLEHLRISPEEYDAAHAVPGRFLMKTGHITVASERIVDSAAGYVVVEKTRFAAVRSVKRPPPEHAEPATLARGPLSRFVCVDCGYGASRSTAPDRCPMCSGSSWDFELWRPFRGPAADPAEDDADPLELL